MTKGWTFQSLVDSKMTVTAFCSDPAWHHKQVLDLVKLRDRFGPDAIAMEWISGRSFAARNATGTTSA
ncbi:hypothetical protein [Mesorhizobium sp. 113-1-2]|uniref:hypothetical protein n=1 Tax=Mesorhizobium sp. 113-1-2 TaxID=2744515 RepID=UPI001FD39A1F|nr:hypothetical protein [Mesorhizobium sp. 113-1-2]